MLFSKAAIVFALPLLRAASVPLHGGDHVDEVPNSLPGAWYHEPTHPVHSLFRRAPDDGTPYPVVGTPGAFLQLRDSPCLLILLNPVFRVDSWISRSWGRPRS